MIGDLLLVFFLSLGCCLALVPGMRSCARFIGAFDYPSRRKLHKTSVPLVGGLACFASILISVFVVNPKNLAGHSEFFVGAALFTLMGYLDDRQERPVVVRLVAQALILFLVLQHDLFLLDLGKIFGSTDFSLGFAAIPVTLFVFVGIVNAVNMTDGIDGLAAVIGITALVGFLAATAQPLILDPASIMHIAQTQQLAGAAIGALIGFLFYNLRTPWRLQASVFLGDAGSMLLGFILGWMAIVTISPGPPTGIDIPPVICLWILIIPLFDAVSCILRRVLERRNPFLADKRHLHHLLLKQGMNQTQVVFALGGTNALGAAIGVISWRLQIPEPLLFWTYLALFGLFTGYVIRFWRREAADLLAEPVLGANTATQSPGGKR